MTSAPITVHIILNAHIDPIWLWSWRDGLDESLGTAYYLCDLLDRHPDLIFTRGEAWFYEQIRRVDPTLFRRIRAHVQAGRWSPVGGWYIQPDCNLPSGFALKRQVELGARLFRGYFGRVSPVAYNVDSFGHAATLPGLIRSAGQRFYVMMRPQEHEMDLPARVFRWRGYKDGPEVAAFRIAKAYCTFRSSGERNCLDEAHVLAAASALPTGLAHTMCFVGIGDHGGGPTEEMIGWCRENRERFPGIRLVFSSPEKFFAAIRRDIPKLPLVVGELQQHAIGCYAIYRPVKTMVRRAEYHLAQAEEAAPVAGRSAAEQRALDRAWKRLCFHHFHDTLGGSCLPSAYEDVHADLGEVLAITEEICTFAVRRRVAGLPPNQAQRIVLLNASSRTFDDYVEVEPHLDWTSWQASWRLIDEKGKVIPCQSLTPESGGSNEARLLFPLVASARQLRVLRIAQGPEADSEPVRPVAAETARLAAFGGPSVEFGPASAMRFPSAPEFPIPELALYEDRTDTWSHGIDRYPPLNRETAVWGQANPIDRGPLMGSLFQRGKIGSSPVQAEWRVYRDKPWIECLLRITWVETHRVLKLEWKLPTVAVGREDGISGGSLQRPLDGRELPLRDWTRLRLRSPGSGRIDAGMICPDVFALDADPERVRLTLLRAGIMACEDEKREVLPRSVFSDRGEHRFRFRFWAAARVSKEELDSVAISLQTPLLTAAATRGMKTRALRGTFSPAITVP